MAVTGITRGPSVVPKYYQVERALRARIARLRPGDSLPPEPELCEEYGVSRTTLRQAMDLLVAEGRLQRFQGRGTFITAARVDYAIDSYRPNHPLRDEAETYRVLSVEHRPADEQMAELLGVEPGTTVLHARRAAYHAGTPMRLIEVTVHPKHMRRLEGADFSKKLITEHLLEHKVPIGSYRISIEVGTLDEQTALEMGLRAGLPTLDIMRLVLDPEDRVVAAIHLVTRGDVGRYLLTISEPPTTSSSKAKASPRRRTKRAQD
jgi:GntR family transcriptional regulator